MNPSRIAPGIVVAYMRRILPLLLPNMRFQPTGFASLRSARLRLMRTVGRQEQERI
jgi:hypothetical protein